MRGSWSIYTGAIPPGARNQLASLGIDPTDNAAVKAYYTTGIYEQRDARPYWFPAWLQLHPELGD
jgi:hypothetical protein